METEFYSANELSKITNIPASTVRRYLENFKDFFLQKHFGRIVKYSESSTVLIKTIYAFYKEGKTTHEITNVLATSHDKVIDIETNKELKNGELMALILEKQKENINSLREDIINDLPLVIDEVIKKRVEERIPVILEEVLKENIVNIIDYALAEHEKKKENKKSIFSRFFRKKYA